MSRLGPFEENTIVVGDCIDVMAQMPDGCVDLVVTDPVYDDIETQERMAENLTRVLRPGGNLLLFSGHAYLPNLLPTLGKHLKYRWIIVEHTLGKQARMFGYHLWIRWKPILWFSRNGKEPLLPKWMPDVLEARVDKRYGIHDWEKKEAVIHYLINHFSEPHHLVADFFIGSGTTAVVADRLGRKFFGCDINPDCVEMALGRLEKDRAGRQLVLL